MHFRTRIQNLFEELFYTEISGSMHLGTWILNGLLGFQGVFLQEKGEIRPYFFTKGKLL